MKSLKDIIKYTSIITYKSEEKVLIVLNVMIRDLNSLYIFKEATLQNEEIEYVALFQDEIEEIKRRVSDTDYQRLERFLARD